MPYDKLTDLPDRVRNNLPRHAQEIYKEAFNSERGHRHKAARPRAVGRRLVGARTT